MNNKEKSMSVLIVIILYCFPLATGTKIDFIIAKLCSNACQSVYTPMML